MSDFNKGAAMMRDLVISHIIGIQNDIGNDVEDKGYQKLQELMELIEEGNWRTEYSDWYMG